MRSLMYAFSIIKIPMRSLMYIFSTIKLPMRSLIYPLSTINMLMRSLMYVFSNESAARAMAALNFGWAVIAERIQFLLTSGHKCNLFWKCGPGIREGVGD